VNPQEAKTIIKELSMKLTNVAVTTIFVIAVTISLAAQDGADLYKKKCSGCHGASGEGKPAMKAPALKGTQLDASQIAEHTAKGNPQSKAPHNKPFAGIDEQQAKAIAEYVKTLK